MIINEELKTLFKNNKCNNYPEKLVVLMSYIDFSSEDADREAQFERALFDEINKLGMKYYGREFVSYN